MSSESEQNRENKRNSLSHYENLFFGTKLVLARNLFWHEICYCPYPLISLFYASYPSYPHTPFSPQRSCLPRTPRQPKLTATLRVSRHKKTSYPATIVNRWLARQLLPGYDAHNTQPYSFTRISYHVLPSDKTLSSDT